MQNTITLAILGIISIALIIGIIVLIVKLCKK